MEAAATGAGIAASVLWARVLNQSPEHGNEPRREPSLYFHRREPSLYSQCITGGAANAFSSALLNPMDVIKTRMQVEVMAGSRKDAVYGSMARSVKQIYMAEGAYGLWSPGLTATMVREMVNCSARTGLYVPVRDALNLALHDPTRSDSTVAEGSFFSRAAAALCTGTLGAVLSNPFDVVKVRLLAAGNAYPSTFQAYPLLAQQEGLRGLFRGVGPSTLRGASIAVGELAAYDQAKHELKRRAGWREGAGLHVGASLLTGVAATTLAAPFDLVKTRAMAGHSAASSVQLLAAAVRAEGVSALFRGWVPAYCRLGPHALICMPVFEQMRAFAGVGYV